MCLKTLYSVLCDVYTNCIQVMHSAWVVSVQEWMCMSVKCNGCLQRKL